MPEHQFSIDELLTSVPYCINVEAESSRCVPSVLPSIYRNALKITEIAQNSQDVSLNFKNLTGFARKFAEKILINYRPGQLARVTSVWLRHQQFYPTDCDNKTLDWLFMLNALNFSLWNPKATKQWTVCGQTGFVALYSAIKRAIDVEGKPLWCPTYYSQLSSEDLNIIFRSDNEITIPLIEERQKVLHEIGTVLMKKFQGTFVNCVEFCRDDGLKLLSLLCKEFESYRDVVNYEGEQGSKAVTLLSDLKHFHKISWEPHYSIFTMFVDYCSPQVFLRLGILSYSDMLKARLEEDEPLEHGSREELEIRCCSLYVCIAVTNYVLKKCETFVGENLVLLKVLIEYFIDNFLWHYRHNNNLDDIPLHNVRSIYY